MNQPELFELQPDDLHPLVRVPFGSGNTYADKARVFNELNPHVYRALVRVCRYLKAKGVHRFGIKATFEALRFTAIQTHGDVYKLNNNFTAWYAREIMRQEADLREFFTLRERDDD